MAEDEDKVDEFYKAAILAGARETFHPAHDWNTIREAPPDSVHSILNACIGSTCIALHAGT
jgi:hypothetical protein